MNAAFSQVPLVQFRHYLKRWKPEEKLTVAERSGGGVVWQPPSSLGDLVGDSSADPSVALFTVSKHAVAKLSDLFVAESSHAVDSRSVLPATEDQLRPFFEDIVRYFQTIKLSLENRWRLRLFAVAPQQSDVYFSIAAKRRTEISAVGAAGSCRDVLVNLGPGAVHLRWAGLQAGNACSRLGTIVDTALYTMIPDGAVLARVQLDPYEGVTYCPRSTLVDLDSEGNDAPAVLLEAVSA